MEFVIISGLSGAGKSKTASFMEDMGYFCVDNLPAPLIPKFAELGMAGSGEYDRVALVTDVRTGTNFDGLFHALDVLEEMKCAYRILFMEASGETIIKRYKETRRSHPLAEEADSLEEAIGLERQMLAPLRERADKIIDSSNLSTAKLKGVLRQMFGRADTGRERMEAVRQVLGLPETIQPFCLVACGYPDKPVVPADRYDAARVHYEKW